MVYLGDRAHGRDNNFNLIRAIAATAVLVSHAYPIALGRGAAEPLEELTGFSLGRIAVLIFFAISGFLISASFVRSSSHTSFLTARTLRLVPGLVVSLLLVAFVMGPLVSTLPTVEYLSHPDTWMFTILNTTLVFLQYTLPGVFETQPYPAVEGSIWTLFHEVVCYLGVLGLGLLGLYRSTRFFVVFLVVYLAFYAGVGWAGIEGAGHRLYFFRTLSVAFVVGMAFYMYREKLPLHWLGVAGLVALAVVLKGSLFYEITLVVALSYATFWLAYVPKGPLLAYNRLGDYSYGIYIYAFPAQGLAVWLFGEQTPLENMLYSLPLTLIPSILSWHFVEDPALAMKSRVVAALQLRRA